MRIYEIPLTPEPQAFGVRLGGKDYRLVLRWREPPAPIQNPGGWILDILDARGETRIAGGIPLVTGTNLLGQCVYLGIPGGLYVATGADTDAVPALDTLGAESKLYFAVAEGVA